MARIKAKQIVEFQDLGTGTTGQYPTWNATTGKYELQDQPIGEKGQKGQPGADSTVAGPTGPTGPQGATGPTGPQGATGPTGPQGEKGQAGADGATGAQGLTGTTGPQGAKGEKGAGSSISGAANNRVITSDGTSNGLVAESGLTYTSNLTLGVNATTHKFTWPSSDSSNFEVVSTAALPNVVAFGAYDVDPNYGLRTFVIGQAHMLNDGVDGEWFPMIWDQGKNAVGIQVSSRQFKRDIKPIGIDADLLFDKVHAVEYKYANDDSDRVQVGFIAEDVEEWDPRFVLHDADGNPKSLDYGRMVPALFEVIKDLRARIEILEQK